MYNIINPHLASYSQHLDALKAKENLSLFDLSAWAETIAQLSLEAQKEALRSLAASSETASHYSVCHGPWKAEGSDTEDWSTKAIVMRNATPKGGCLLVLVSVEPTFTTEGRQLFNEAYAREAEDCSHLGKIERARMNSDELMRLRADEDNFEDFSDCPVNEISIAYYDYIDNLQEEIRSLRGNQHCHNLVAKAKMNQHHSLTYRDGDGYAVEVKCNVTASDATDALQVISEFVENSPYSHLVDRELNFIREHGIETFVDDYDEINSLAARSILDAGGLVNGNVQDAYDDLVQVVLNTERDIDYLTALPGILRENGYVDEEYECNDGRNTAHLKGGRGANEVVVFHTQHGTYEARYNKAGETFPAKINLFRVKPLSKDDRDKCGFLVHASIDARQLCGLVEVDGRYTVSSEKGSNPVDGHALRDLNDIFSSVQTITANLKEDAKPSSPRGMC